MQSQAWSGYILSLLNLIVLKKRVRVILKQESEPHQTFMSTIQLSFSGFIGITFGQSFSPDSSILLSSGLFCYHLTNHVLFQTHQEKATGSPASCLRTRFVNRPASELRWSPTQRGPTQHRALQSEGRDRSSTRTSRIDSNRVTQCLIKWIIHRKSFGFRCHQDRQHFSEGFSISASSLTAA